ncbi:MAG TPA: hypothetical protein VFO83_12470, partial [Aggregicoccus sp.]|nr:hypothetical protein [Aggregicoccus sp.]
EGCDRSTLARIEAQGEFTMQVRYEELGTAPNQCTFFGSDAFILNPDGSGFVSGAPLSSQSIQSGSFLVAGAGTTNSGAQIRRVLVGCEAPSADELVGCYHECRNGALRLRGTFRAVRAGPRAGEPEARGLRLVSESATPKPSSVTSTIPFTAADVFVTKGHAYVSVIRGGLFVFDLSNPAAPVLTQHQYDPSDNYFNAVWAKGDALYVASGTTGVRVYDIGTDPAHPQFRTSRVSPQGNGEQRNIHTLHVDGNFLYAAANLSGSVSIYDVTDPLSPVYAGDYRPTNFDAQRFYGPHDMRAFEGHLYVNAWEFGLYVADVTNPASPAERGHYTYPRATSHAVAVGRVNGRLLAFEGGEQWGAHLRVLDVSNPASIRLIGEYKFAQHLSIHNLELVGTKLYVAHYQAGLRVLDVSVPETPLEVAHYNTFRPTDPNRGDSFYDGAIGVRVPGDGYVYVVDTSRGLLILQEN